MARTSTAISKTFAERLSDLIAEAKERGVQIRELAEEIGVSAGSLSQYQNDSATASIDALYKISNYFNVSTDFLLGKTNVRTDETNVRKVCDYTGLDEDVVKKLHFRQKKHYKGSMLLLNYLLTDGTILSDLGEYYSANFWDKDNIGKYRRFFQIPPRSKGHLLGNLLNDLPLDSEDFYNQCKENPQLKELMGCTYVENELQDNVKRAFQDRLYKKFNNEPYMGEVKMDETDKAIFDFLTVTGNIEILRSIIDLQKLENRINSDLAEAEQESFTNESNYDCEKDSELPF